MPYIGQDKNRRIKLIIIGVILVLVVLGIFNYFVISMGAETAKIDRANAKRQYGWAKIIIWVDMHRRITKDQKVVFLGRLAATDQNRGDLKATLAAQKQIDQLVPNQPTTIYAIAKLAEKVGDKATAVEYYNKAIAQLQAHKDQDPVYEDDLKELQDGLKRNE